MVAAVNGERRLFNDNPRYQRESGVWSLSKQQLLIDSLLNDYDIPKIYLHDLQDEYEAHRSQYKFAVIDGKQRLHAIWRFLDSEFPLAQDFVFTGSSPPVSPTRDIAGKKFRELDANWRTYLEGKAIDTILIRPRNDDEIDDLFSRLNNGEALNAAEQRNAFGGRMCELVRSVAAHKFFDQNLAFENIRYSYLEVAAKILLIEWSQLHDGPLFVDLKKPHLDDLVRSHKIMSPSEERALMKRTTAELDQLRLIFTSEDPLLSRQAYVPMYFLFNRYLKRKYRGVALNSKLPTFLADFTVRRKENLELDENDQDSTLINFGRLIQQGTNDRSSLEDRVVILTRYFLAAYPDSVFPAEGRRRFDDEERRAIYLRAGGKCQSPGCQKKIAFADMHADHSVEWIKGGATTLANAQCLCVTCNSAKR